MNLWPATRITASPRTGLPLKRRGWIAAGGFLIAVAVCGCGASGPAPRIAASNASTLRAEVQRARAALSAGKNDRRAAVRDLTSLERSVTQMSARGALSSGAAAALTRDAQQLAQKLLAEGSLVKIETKTVTTTKTTQVKAQTGGNSGAATQPSSQPAQQPKQPTQAKQPASGASQPGAPPGKAQANPKPASAPAPKQPAGSGSTAKSVSAPGNGPGN